MVSNFWTGHRKIRVTQNTDPWSMDPRYEPDPWTTLMVGPLTTLMDLFYGTPPK